MFMQCDQPVKPYRILGWRIGKIQGGAHRRARRRNDTSRTAPWDVILCTPHAWDAEQASVTVAGENTDNLAARSSSATPSFSLTHPRAEHQPQRLGGINKISGALGRDGCLSWVPLAGGGTLCSWFFLP